VVVLEPDGLAQLDCLAAGPRQERLDMLRSAVGVLSSAPGAVVYLDAGNSGWIGAAAMADRLRSAGVGQASGFALNVSNFHRTNHEVAFGDDLSGRLDGAHYVVDTSRNGPGPVAGDRGWCNPRGRALGDRPTTNTGSAAADAYLWIKMVGQSDGECGRGEPAAGTWWPEYAIGLAQRAAY
jgi:endoglucanase